MKDLKNSKQIIGMRITNDKIEEILDILQKRYIEKVLSRFNLDDAKTKSILFEKSFQTYEGAITKEKWS